MIRKLIVILCVSLVATLFLVSSASSMPGPYYKRQGYVERPTTLQKIHFFDDKITTRHVFKFNEIRPRESRTYRDLPPLPRIRPAVRTRIFITTPRPFHYG